MRNSHEFVCMSNDIAKNGVLEKIGPFRFHRRTPPFPLNCNVVCSSQAALVVVHTKPGAGMLNTKGGLVFY